MSRFRAPLILAAAVLAGAALLLVIARKPGDSSRAASACPRGYETLARAEGERAREEGEHSREAKPAHAVDTSRICRPAAEVEGTEEFARTASVRRLRMTGGYASVAPGAYAHAVRQRERSQARAAAAAPVAGAAGVWTPKGTTPLYANDASYDVSKEGLALQAGRINDYDYDPDHQRVYAAVSYGGVWVSDDLAGHWRSIGDSLPTQIVGSVAYSPAGGREGTVLALTGDQNNGADSFTGFGVFRSTDGGKTWTHARGVPSGTMGFKITVDPTRPDVVYAATGFGLYRSTDDGASFADVDLPTGGCHGETWTKKDCFFANVVSDVVVEAPDSFGHKGGNVLAAVGWRAGTHAYPDGAPQAPANGLYASGSGEPGSFKRLDATGFTEQQRIGRTELGVAVGPKQNHDIVYAEVQDAELLNGGVPGIDIADAIGSNNVYRPTYFNGVYVSKDFGKTWTQIATIDDLAAPGTGSALTPIGAVPVIGSYLPGIQAWYNEWIRPDPTLQSAEGAPLRLSFGLEEIWQNRGTSTPLDGSAQPDWHVIGRYYAGEVCQLGLVPTVPGLVPCPTDEVPTTTTTHPDQHGAVWVPDGKGGVTLLAGNDGGAYAQHAAPGQQMDNTRWGQGANTDLHTLLPYDAAMAKDGTIVAGLQDNGEMKIAPDGRQSEIYGGDAFYTAVDPDDSNTIYEEYVTGVMRVTKDGGHTWRSMSTNEEVNGNGAQFSAPLAMDPLDAKHLVAGGSDVLETTGGAETSSRDEGDVANTPVTAAGFDPTRPQWQSVFTLPNGTDDNASSITALAVLGPAVYAGYCGKCDLLTGGTFGSGIATNAGGSGPAKLASPDGWHTAKAEGLPKRIINSLAIDASDPKTVAVGLGGYNSRRWLTPGVNGEDTSKVGKGHVFVSSDAGATFKDASGDLPDVPVESVLIHGSQLIAGTDVGAFISVDRNGSHWVPLGSGLPNAPVTALHPAPGGDGTLLAAAYGRGIYTYRFASAGQRGCRDALRPSAKLARAASTARISRRGRLTIRGTARDRGCLKGGKGKLRRVTVALARKSGKGCRFVTRSGRLGRRGSCRKPSFIKASGTSHWRLTFKRAPRAGRYVAYVRATDAAGNRSRIRAARVRVLAAA